MPDIRYHFIYLIAVFLMLGIGLLVGASFIGPDQVKRQTVYIRDLKAQTDQLAVERRAMQDQQMKTDAALDELRLNLVRGKLAGRHVTLIQTGDYPDAVQEADQALQDAGAVSTVTVTLAERWQTLTANQRAADLAGLASGLNGREPDALKPLEDQGLIKVTGTPAGPSTLFVLVGGSKDELAGTPLDGELIQSLKDQSQGQDHIVGCEPFIAVQSSVPIYEKASIPTVDCIDRPLGRLALPFALRDDGSAVDYGLKPTAQRQLPASLEAQANL